MPRGKSFGFNFTEEGIYNYFCAIHPESMSATVTVVPEGALGGTGLSPTPVVEPTPAPTPTAPTEPLQPTPHAVTTPTPAVPLASLDEATLSPIKGFTLERLFVTRGGNVTWVNQDSTPHTTTSGVSPDRDNVWDSGVLNPGESYAVTFDKPGEFPYYCTIHPSMTGLVVVADVGSASKIHEAAVTSPSSTATPQANPSPTPSSTVTPTGAPMLPAPATVSPAPQTPTPAAPTPTPEPRSITLTPSKDNTLYESRAGGLSNGAGRHMFAGNTADGVTRRAVVAFDLSGIPSGATITGVALTLNMSRTSSEAHMVNLHLVTSDWGEGGSRADGNQGAGTSAQPGDATWVHTFYNVAKWSHPGGDFDPEASGSTRIGEVGEYRWSSDQMIADVQAWVDGRVANFGWILVGDESAERSAKRFDTKESVESPVPALAVDFTSMSPGPVSDTTLKTADEY